MKALRWLVLALALVGCESEVETIAPEIVLLGVDGFDWAIVDPLVEQGRMPVVEGLLANGTRADLLTLVPFEKSPIIWTTIATGRLPGEKGRGFFSAPLDSTGKRRAYTAWNRRYRAFWNILPTHGLTVSVLGWLETWPAETVDGTIVTDYVQYYVAEEEKAERFEHRTHPAELFEEVEPLIVYANDVPVDSLQKFVDVEIGGPDDPPPLRSGLKALQWIYAGDLSFTAIARHFLRNRPEDLMAIYLRGPDAVCHRFWGEREDLAAGKTSPQATRFGETVDRYFVETDALIGQIVEEIDFERTTLVIVSDHGFQGARRALDGSVRSGIWMHRELGTILVVGPHAAGRGIRADGTRVYDVLPTILHALNLPVAEDMDGEVAFTLLSREGGRERPVQTIPTYETGEITTPDLATESPVDEQILERVQSLGYIE